jgi:GNAT superfamily N-acetyltransferase
VNERPSWTVRRATAADRDAALALLHRAFGESSAGITPDIWEWLFVRNPAADKLYYVVAELGARLVGQYATAPAMVQHDGKPVRALVSLHTATDPEFERQGIFRTLADRLYADTAAEVPVVYGFPNPASAPVFYSRLGWKELRPFPLVVRPLRGGGPFSAIGDRIVGLPGGLLDRRRDGEVTPLARFGDWADELWSDLSPILGPCAVRDARYLNWRFVDTPLTYRRYALVRHGKPVAFAVLAFAPWRGRTAAYVMELMARPSDRSAARMLLQRLVADAREAGAAVAIGVVTKRHPHRGRFVGAGFVPLPGRIRTSFSFGVRPNGPSIGDVALARPEEWFISGADLDYV